MSSLEKRAGSLDGWLERSSKRDGRCDFLLRGGGGRGISFSMLLYLYFRSMQLIELVCDEVRCIMDTKCQSRG